MTLSAIVASNATSTSASGNDPSRGENGRSTGWDRRCDRCRADLPTGAFQLAIDSETSRRPPLDFTRGDSGSSAMYRLCAAWVHAVATWMSDT